MVVVGALRQQWFALLCVWWLVVGGVLVVGASVVGAAMATRLLVAVGLHGPTHALGRDDVFGSPPMMNELLPFLAGFGVFAT